MGATRRRRMKARRQWQMAMRRKERKIQAGIDVSVIPPGPYCYVWPDEGFRCCPFWDKRPEHGTQNDGYCHLLEIGDWMIGFGLLWDQVKECGINDRREDDSEV